MGHNFWKKIRYSGHSGSVTNGCMCPVGFCHSTVSHTYLLDVLWGQPIKLIQVASTSEFCENQQSDLLFFEMVPFDLCGASEVQT